MIHPKHLETVAEALWRAEHAAFNWEGQSACCQAHYRCMAGVALDTLNEALSKEAFEPGAESEDMIDPNLPGFDISPQPAPETLEQSWKERMGLA